MLEAVETETIIQTDPAKISVTESPSDLQDRIIKEYRLCALVAGVALGLVFINPGGLGVVFLAPGGVAGVIGGVKAQRSKEIVMNNPGYVTPESDR